MIGQVALKKPAVLRALSLLGAAGTNVETEYQAVLTYAATQGYALPSATNQAQQNKLVRDLKGAGIWADLDVFYNFLTDGDANFAKINWKAPGTFQAVGTGHEPTFIPVNGFKSDGLTQYLNTQWVAGAGKLVQNSGSFFFDLASFNYATGGGTAQKHICGGAVTNATCFWLQASGPILQWDISAAGVASQAVSMVPGFFMAQRVNATQKSRYYNGVFTVTLAENSVPLEAVPIYLQACNLNGVAGRFLDCGLSCWGAGAALVGKELALYNAWADYKAATAYQRIIAYANTQGFSLPSTSNRAKQELLIADMIKAGVWDELDVFYNFLTDGGASFAKINWKAPGTFSIAQTGAVTFTPLNSFTGAGGYFSPVWFPTAGSKFTPLSASFFVDAVSNNRSVGALVGYLGTGGVSASILPNINNSNALRAVVYAPDMDVANASSLGFYQVSTNSNNTKVFKNSALVVSGAAVAGGTFTVPILIFARVWQSSGGQIIDLCNESISVVGFGASLAGKELALYNAWNKYKTTPGGLYTDGKVVLIDTDGFDKGFRRNQFGTIASEWFGGVTIDKLDLRPDDVIELKMLDGVRLESVSVVRLFIGDEDFVDLYWNGVDQYEGMAPVSISSQFVVSNVVLITLIALED